MNNIIKSAISKDSLNSNVVIKNNISKRFISNLDATNKFKQEDQKNQMKIKDNFNSELEQANNFLNSINQKKNKEHESVKQIDDKSRLKLNHILQNETDIRIRQSLEKKDNFNSYTNPIHQIEKKQNKILSSTPEPYKVKSNMKSYTNAYSPKNFNKQASFILSKQKPFNVPGVNESLFEQMNNDDSIHQLANETDADHDKNHSNNILKMMEGDTRDKAALELRIEEISKRLSSIQNHKADEMGKKIQDRFLKNFKEIDDECVQLLKEFKDISANPIMLNWRDDYTYFYNNFEKLQNLNEFVDVYENSFERSRKENEAKKISNRISQLVLKDLEEQNPDDAKLDKDAPEFYKHQAYWKAKKRRFFPVYKKQNQNDNQMDTLSVQKQDQDFQTKLAQQVKLKNPELNVIQPDLSFERQNVWRWWEYEINDQVKLYESRQYLLSEFKNYNNTNNKYFTNNMNVARTFKKFYDQHKSQMKDSLDKDIIQ